MEDRSCAGPLRARALAGRAKMYSGFVKMEEVYVKQEPVEEPENCSPSDGDHEIIVHIKQEPEFVEIEVECGELLLPARLEQDPAESGPTVKCAGYENQESSHDESGRRQERAPAAAAADTPLAKPLVRVKTVKELSRGGGGGGGGGGCGGGGGGAPRGGTARNEVGENRAAAALNPHVPAAASAGAGSRASSSPYSCDICNKHFVNMRNLKSHLRIHNDVKPYSCETCDKRFRRFDHMITHQHTHTGVKQHACEICKKEFTQLSYLQVHKRLHTGEKPFSCKVCHKEFTCTNYLNRHLRIHTGEKPYACDLCEKRFTQSHSLLAHKIIHSGEKPFVCDICNEGFARRYCLTVHKKNHLKKASSNGPKVKKAVNK